jgi:hypothetical protein
LIGTLSDGEDWLTLTIVNPNGSTLFDIAGKGPYQDLGVTVPPEFVASLPRGTHGFEVLAIEAGGNQTITAGSFVKE